MGRDPRIDRGQLAQLTARRRRLDAGERSLGWKLGMGTSKAMADLGISAPLVGYLLESARLESGAACDISGWENPRLEPEIAVHMASDLPGGVGREEASRAIGGVGVAIELVDPDPSVSDPEPILAADIFQRGVLVGPARDGAGSLAVGARILVNGEEAAATDDATEATGDPVGLVAHVATTLERAGERLRAGEVVICGSVVPALAVAPGDEVEVTLDGLGSLSVRFA